MKWHLTVKFYKDGREKKNQVLSYFFASDPPFLAPPPLTPWPSPLSSSSADTTPSPSDTIPL